MNDEKAIELAKNGRTEGFNSIFENHAAYLFTLAFRVLKHKELAEDAVQNTFASAFTHISSFKGESRLRTWLYTILTRSALKEKIKIKDSLEYLPELEGKEDKSYENSENFADVRNVLKLLNEKDKAILIMSYWDDLSTKEIAKVLDIKTNNVKILLYRARKNFKRHWNNVNQIGELSNEL